MKRSKISPELGSRSASLLFFFGGHVNEYYTWIFPARAKGRKEGNNKLDTFTVMRCGVRFLDWITEVWIHRKQIPISRPGKERLRVCDCAPSFMNLIVTFSTKINFMLHRTTNVLTELVSSLSLYTTIRPGTQSMACVCLSLFYALWLSASSS